MSNQSFSQNSSAVQQAYKNASVATAEKKKSPPRITLRLSEDELAKLKNLSNGMSLNAYIRKCLFGKDATPRKVRSRVPVKDQEALAQALGLLGQTRISNNLNQIAHEANCGSLLMDDYTEIEIKKACAHIAFIRVKLIEALGLKGGGKL